MTTPNLQKQTLSQDADPVGLPTNADGLFGWVTKTLMPWLLEQLRQLRFASSHITTDNFASRTLTSPGGAVAANVEFIVTHNLGRIPSVYVANWNVNPVAGSIVYKGATAWTTTLMYLKCSQALNANDLTLLIL